MIFVLISEEVKINMDEDAITAVQLCLEDVLVEDS